MDQEMKEKEKIKLLNQKIMEADNEGNLSDVLSCYTVDIIWIPPKSKVIKGKNAISERYKMLYDTYKLDISLEESSISIDKVIATSYGLTRGRMISKEDGSEIAVNDNFLMIYTKLPNDNWLVNTLMWNRAAS